VNKALLIARANDQTRAVGAENPILSISYSGFVNGDSSAALDDAPEIFTAASASSNTGTYPITLSGGADDNYELTLRGGVMIVTGQVIPPLFPSSPVGTSASAGGTAVFTAEVGGDPAPGLQWQMSSDGGLTWTDLVDGKAYSGALTPSLTVSNVSAAMNGQRFRLLATNIAATVASGEAVLTVNANRVLAGSYFGQFQSGGRWALYVTDEQRGTFIAHLPHRASALLVDVMLSAGGAFLVPTAEVTAFNVGIGGPESETSGEKTLSEIQPLAGTFWLEGLIDVNGRVTGSASAIGETFSGEADSGSGNAPDVKAMLYTGAALGTKSGTTQAIVGSSGNAFVLFTSPAGIDSAIGTVDNDRLSATTFGGGTVNASLQSSAGSLAATYLPAGAAVPIRFSGLADDVPSTTRMVAISTRSRAARGDQTLIMGYAIAGAGEKQVIVRGVGPSLKPFGVNDALADPRVLLYEGSTVLDQNDDWGGSEGMMQTFRRLGMSAMESTASKDAALLRPTKTGVYTAHVTTGTEASGIALVEVYDGDTEPTSRFTALATRTIAGSGENTLIAGIVLAGNAPKKLLVRGVGPTLIMSGVTAASTLQDPRLAIFSGSEVIAENDNWGGSQEVMKATAAVGLSHMLSADSKDAALLVTLEPGVYTVHVSGVNNTSGVALIEVYEMP
jgi:hypothetical protein